MGSYLEDAKTHICKCKTLWRALENGDESTQSAEHVEENWLLVSPQRQNCNMRSRTMVYAYTGQRFEGRRLVTQHNTVANKGTIIFIVVLYMIAALLVIYYFLFVVKF